MRLLCKRLQDVPAVVAKWPRSRVNEGNIDAFVRGASFEQLTGVTMDGSDDYRRKVAMCAGQAKGLQSVTSIGWPFLPLLAKHQGLRRLYVSSRFCMPIRVSWTELHNFTCLMDLCLNCQRLTDEDLRNLASCPFARQLRYLDLSGNAKLSEAQFLAEFRSLRHLNLSATSLTLQFVACPLESLVLRFMRTSVSGPDLAKLTTKLVNLELWSSKVEDLAAFHFGSLRNIEWDIDCSQFEPTTVVTSLRSCRFPPLSKIFPNLRTLKTHAFADDQYSASDFVFRCLTDARLANYSLLQGIVQGSRCSLRTLALDINTEPWDNFSILTEFSALQEMKVESNATTDACPIDLIVQTLSRSMSQQTLRSASFLFPSERTPFAAELEGIYKLAALRDLEILHAGLSLTPSASQQLRSMPQLRLYLNNLFGAPLLI